MLVCLVKNLTDHDLMMGYFVTLITRIINKVACNLPRYYVDSQWYDTTCSLTRLITTVSWIFLCNDLFSKITTQPQNPDHCQAPSRTYKSIRCSKKWDKCLVLNTPYSVIGHQVD